MSEDCRGFGFAKARHRATQLQSHRAMSTQRHRCANAAKSESRAHHVAFFRRDSSESSSATPLVRHWKTHLSPPPVVTTILSSAVNRAHVT